MLTAPELRLSLHYILQSRDAVCDELQRRNGLTPDEIRQLAVQLAEYDQMIMTALGVERSFGGGAKIKETVWNALAGVARPPCDRHAFV